MSQNVTSVILVILSMPLASNDNMNQFSFNLKKHLVAGLSILGIGSSSFANYHEKTCGGIFNLPATNFMNQVNQVNQVNTVNGDYPTNKNAISDSRKTTLAFEVNKTRLLGLNGTSGYSSNLITLIFRELLQNSVDADAREKVALASKKSGFPSMLDRISKVFNDNSKNQSTYRGKINVLVDPKKNWIVVEDNGTGMNLNTIQKAFLTLGGTEKGDDAIGGFGIAKGALISGSQKIFVSTVRDGLMHEFLINSQHVRSDENAKIDVVTTKAKGQPNGTIIVIELLDNSHPLPSSETSTELYNKPFLIEDIDISFANTNIPNSIEQIRSTLIQIQPSVALTKKPFFKKMNLSGPSMVKDLMSFPWGDVEILISKDKVTNGRPRHFVLGNGMFQFQEYFRDQKYEAFPYQIIVNIKSKVMANESNYPFNLTRDGIRPSISEDYKQLVGRITKNIQQIISNDVDKMTSTFRPLSKISLQARFERLKKSHNFKKIYFNVKVSTCEKERGSETDVINFNKSSVYSSLNTPLFNNRTTMNFEDIESEALAFFSEMASVADHIMSRLIEVGLLSNEQYLNFLGTQLEKYKSGIFLKKGIHGIRIHGSVNGIFFNPLSEDLSITDGDLIIGSIYTTIIHEITHLLVREHNELFIMREEKISDILKVDGYDIIIRSAIAEILLEHQGIFEELRSRFHDDSVENLDLES